MEINHDGFALITSLASAYKRKALAACGDQVILEMAPLEVPCVTLRSCGDEITMPVIGMGTSSHLPADRDTAKAAILEAIKEAYATSTPPLLMPYGNSEQHLGEATTDALRVGLVSQVQE